MVGTTAHTCSKSWCVCALMYSQCLYRPKCRTVHPEPAFRATEINYTTWSKFGVQRSDNYFLPPICRNMDNLLPFASSSTISSTKFLTKSRSCWFASCTTIFPVAHLQVGWVTSIIFERQNQSHRLPQRDAKEVSTPTLPIIVLHKLQRSCFRIHNMLLAIAFILSHQYMLKTYCNRTGRRG